MIAKYFRLTLILLVGALAMFSATACQRSSETGVQAAGAKSATDRSALNQDDRDFVVNAEKANLQERFLGRLALEKSENRSVKDYAQMLIDDHTKALRSLVDLMEQKKLNQPKTLPEARAEEFDRFKGLSGSAFDREFIAMMVDDHAKAVAMFKHEAGSGQDNDVRKYARDVLPTLEKHLQKAKALEESGLR